MDKDENGVDPGIGASGLMGETFDRPVINRSGQLERNEVWQMTNPN